MPKSPSPALPSAASQTLSGLTSRWTTPCSCAWASASASARPVRSTSATPSRPPGRRRAGRRASRPPCSARRCAARPRPRPRRRPSRRAGGRRGAPSAAPRGASARAPRRRPRRPGRARSRPGGRASGRGRARPPSRRRGRAAAAAGSDPRSAAADVPARPAHAVCAMAVQRRAPASPPRPAGGRSSGSGWGDRRAPAWRRTLKTCRVHPGARGERGSPRGRMAAARATREISSRPLPPSRSPPGGTDALRTPDGTAAGELCKASPASARRPAHPPRSPPRLAVPPPHPARGGGRAPPGAPQRAQRSQSR